MRSKEEAHDYRYFPDPDLLPLELEQAWIDDDRGLAARTARREEGALRADYGLSPYDAGVLVAERAAADFFEEVAPGARRQGGGQLGDQRAVRPAEQGGQGDRASPVSPAQLGEILDLIAEGTISGKIAKDLFEIVWTEGGDPREIVEERGMRRSPTPARSRKAVDEVIAANPDAGREGEGQAPMLAGWFVGQVMKATGGKANPQAVNELFGMSGLGKTHVSNLLREAGGGSTTRSITASAPATWASTSSTTSSARR
jgi:aspartyl-tRNA(Asn)/glutamyl-tRNA(Gln) amidotransferase subunit B